MTLSERAYRALRQDIVSGAFAPKMPLRMTALAARYEMGFAPLREALNRLQADRLVVAAPLKGFTVATISVAQMSDTISTRLLIETQALALSIKHGDDNWEALIVSSLHSLNLAAERLEKGQTVDPIQMEQRHHAFHRAIISACQSSWLLDFFERLYTESERYRAPLLLAATHPSSRNVRAEHSALSAATLARDTSTATALLKDHYKTTEEAIKAMMESQELSPALAV